MVRSIFVEKKQGFDIEAKKIYDDLKNNLKLENLKGLRLINRYFVENIGAEAFKKAKTEILSDPVCDIVWEDNLPQELLDEIENVFGIELLIGQYDQRSDSAEQCIKLIYPMENPKVRSGKIIYLQGELAYEEVERVKRYLINPVETREAELEIPKTLELEDIDIKREIVLDGFNSKSEEELAELKEIQGFAMSLEDIKVVQKYFKEEDRNPTMTELKVLDTYWSDHCRHTTFMTELTDVEFEQSPYGKVVKRAFSEYLEMRKELYGNKALVNGENGGRDINLMDIACIGSKYLQSKGIVDDLDISDEINACSIKTKAKIDGKVEDWVVMFKNETHNHPTEIEPFGGAATCLGGAIRDPLSGRVYVYQAMRVTGASDPTVPLNETLKGKLPQKVITQKASDGYSSYGNQIGLATGLVKEIYHPNFVAKRMEVGAVIGAAPFENIKREKPKKDDAIILLGGKTGRDGLGGATGSSKEHDLSSLEECGAEVQKGNPPVERDLQRFFRRKEASTLIKKCNDFGAGGVSVAIGELADSIDVFLNKIPKKYQGLSGMELAIAESQERMAVVVASQNVDEFIKIAEEENIEATVVAKVTDTGRFRMEFDGEYILDLKRSFLDSNGAKQRVQVKVEAEKTYPYNKEEILEQFENEFNSEIALKTLADLNNCSQRGLIEKFDSSIGGNSVFMGLGGKYQLTQPQGMVAKLPVLKGETDTVTIMTQGYDPYIAEKSPYHGAMMSVIDSVTKIVAIGGEYSKARLSFQEYFEKLTDENSWGKPLSALLGALRVQKELGTPAIGGKDSMSGTFMDINVPPTLISFAVAVGNAENIITPEFKKFNSKLILVDLYIDENGEPDFNQYRANMDKVARLIKDKKVLSAYALGKGGLFVGAFNMSVGNKIGFRLKNIEDKEIIADKYGAMLLEVEDGFAEKILDENFDWKQVGETIDGNIEVILKEGKIVTIPMKEAVETWEKPLENVFNTETKGYEKVEVENIAYEKRGRNKTALNILKGKKPEIVVPVFFGTNCEVDTQLAFEKAGGNVTKQIIRNLTPKAMEESIEQLAEKINNSNIVCIPGGFSGGDEPDGSAKFITAVFRNEKIKEAVHRLLNDRDGLMLGICNGFQALIKLGLVPYGEIRPLTDSSPTLTYNNIGRHQSKIVQTKISSVKSPWFADFNLGDIHSVPISHGEGRFIATENVLQELKANGQIATQYVGINGELTNSQDINPNGSIWNIEAITSKDGRVLGKMAHSERAGQNVHKNIYGNKEQNIFKAGVNYFK